MAILLDDVLKSLESNTPIEKEAEIEGRSMAWGFLEELEKEADRLEET